MSFVHILNDMNSRPLICSFRLNWKNIWLKTVVHLWTCQAELNINFNFNLFLTQSYCVTSEDLEYNTLFCCFVFASVRKVTDLNCGWVNHYIIFCFRWTICLLLLNFYFFYVSLIFPPLLHTTKNIFSFHKYRNKATFWIGFGLVSFTVGFKKKKKNTNL